MLRCISARTPAGVIFAIADRSLFCQPLTTSPYSGPSGVRARVGFRPNNPHADAGYRIEPPKSSACAIGVMPAATAAAEPPLEPLVAAQGQLEGQTLKGYLGRGARNRW